MSPSPSDHDNVVRMRSGALRDRDDLPPDTHEEAVARYESSEVFLSDAVSALVDFLLTVDPETASPDLRDRLAHWYRQTDAYSTVLDDMLAGDR